MRVLIVEDTENDAALIQLTLRRAGYELTSRVVDSAETMRDALESQQWDVITSDHSMPGLNAPAALALAQELQPDVPLIIVSGEIDLNLAVALMRGGAKDYIQKKELPRLIPAIERELREVELHRSQQLSDRALQKTNQRLHVALEKLKKAQAIAHVGDWTWDVKESQIEWSDEMYRIFGIEKNSYTGRLGSAIATVIHPDDLHIVHPSNASIFAQQKQVEYRIIWPDGSIRYIDASTGEVLLDKDGAPVSITGTCQDITERKQAEKTLMESEERYRALVDWMPEAIIVHREGKILFVNPSTIALFGAAAADELLGTELFDRVHPDFQERAKTRRIALTEKGGSVPVIEEKLLKMDGSVITAEVQTRQIVYNGEVSLHTSIRDITERKQAEEALRKNEANLAQAQQIAHLGSWEWDMVLNRVHWSKEMYRLFDIDPASYDGSPESLLAHIHPDDVEIFSQSLTTNLTNGKSPTLEYRVIHRDGSVHTLLGNGEVEFDAAGTPLRSVGTVQDITERKKITEELFESQTTLTNIINSLPHSIFWKDLDGLYLGCNETFAREVGLDSPEKIIGKTDYDLPWSSNAADAYRRDDREVIERNQSKRHIIEQVQTAAGPNIWVDTTKVPLADDHGNIYGVLGIFEDITARKQIDDAMRESEKELHSLAEAMPQIVWITRPDGWNVYLSQRWVDYTGLSLEESYGHGWIKPFHPEDQQRAWDAWQHATQTGSHYALECRMRRFDGVYTWWLIRGIPLLDQQGNILKWFGTCTDIHELKKVEEELRENKAILQAALDNSPAGIAIADAPDGKLRYVNDSGLLIRGGDRESIVNGIGIDQYVASWQILDLDGKPLAAEKVPLARAVLFGEANSREFIVRRASNDDRIVLGNAAPILDEGGQVRAAIVVFTDITERKQTEKKIEEQLDELRRWHNITLGREERVLELKGEVNQLLEQAGLPPRYPSAKFTTGA